MDRILLGAARRPAIILVVLAALTVAMFAQVIDLRTQTPRLEIDPSIGRLLPADDPERALYERMRHIFGSDESVLVAVSADEPFGQDNLQRTERMSERFLALPHAQSVLSLTTARSLRADESGIEFTGEEQRDFSDPQVREDLRADILDNPLYARALLSADQKTSALVIYFKGVTDKDFIDLGIAAQISQIAAEESDAATIWISGSPVIKTAVSAALMDSFRVMVPSILAIVSVVLLIAFRSLRAVLLPVIAILIALAWTLGLLVLAGRPLNIVTTLVPPLVITLGLAFAMHVISEYYSVCHASTSTNKRELVREVLQQVGIPLLVSAGTTICGLLALSLNSLAAIREFSILSATGVLCAVISVLTFIPAVLCFLPVPAGKAKDTGDRHFHSWTDRLVDFDLRRRRAILATGIVVLVVASIGTARIEVGTEYIGGFATTSRVRTDYESINQSFNGANFFYIILESEIEDTFVEPDNIALIDSLQQWLAIQPEVGGSTSLVDHIRLINQTMHEGDSNYHVIPDNKQLAKQLLLFGGSEDLGSYVDSTYQMTNIRVRVTVDDTRDISSLVDRTRDWLKRLPYPLQASVTGNLMLSTRTVEDIAAGQLFSIGAALVVVWLILSVMFTSMPIGAVALFPNLITVSVYFGTLGLLGITLNPTTSLIACIALGIAVDDTIHFMVRFNTEARATAQEGQAVHRALAGVIRPVTYTSLVLVLSFLVLTTSELLTQVQFGALAALTIAVAWLVDLTLTPALGGGMRIVTLWDVLRLDLGDKPQETIPLFRDLSLRQARIFALMADIRPYEAGARLFTEGEEATDEAFVIIDGDLRAWVERDSGEVELSRMGRGEVVGEGGAFGRTRSSNVDILSDSRLLRFTTDHLESLRIRYPRIAAAVYRNINTVQAERMAQDVSRVRK